MTIKQKQRQGLKLAADTSALIAGFNWLFERLEKPSGEYEGKIFQLAGTKCMIPVRAC